MKWSSAVSDARSIADAVSQCAETIEADFVAPTPDLIVAFASAHYSENLEAVPELIREHIGDGLLVGCSGGGVIGAGREVEHRPGFAVTVAHLPEVDLVPFHIENDGLPDADSAPDKWEDLVGTRAEEQPQFILLADPFSIAAESLVMGLDYAFPGSVKIGGLASGAQQPGGSVLYLSDRTYRSGAVGVSMHGAIAVDTIVAQGCRPIGDPMQVTSCSRNILLGLDEHKPNEVLARVFDGLSERDRQLAQHSLFLGVVMDPLNDSPQLGDYLIRNIVGVDPGRGALVIGETLDEGQTVQFHLRDAEASAQDLDALLTRYARKHPIYEDTGALLFSCLGRGEHLYGRPDHDTEMFREKVAAMPLTGFFCNGEIGQVGGTTYLHGYTSSFGIFRPRYE